MKTYKSPDINWQPIYDLFDDLMEEHGSNTKKAMREFAQYCHAGERHMELALQYAFDMLAQLTPSEEEEARMEEAH